MKSMVISNLLPGFLACVLAAVLCVPVIAQEEPYVAAVVLLNREDDCSPLTNGTQVKCGVNLDVQTNDNQGSVAFELGVGMLLSSAANGTGQTPTGRPRGFAGQNQGGGTVLTGARFPTIIRGGGAVMLGGGAQWLPSPVFSPDGGAFLDPLRGVAQPAPAAPLDALWGNSGAEPRAHSSPIAGGPDATNATPLRSGIYYSTETNSSSNVVANGQPVRLGPGHFRFEPAVGQFFGEFVFIGGLLAPGGAVHIEVGPGLYFFAGAQESSNKPGNLLRLSNGSTFSDGGPVIGPALNAGELFIFSDARLPGIFELAQFIEATIDHDLTNLILGSTSFAPLRQGIAGIQGPSNGHISVNVHGLTDQAPVEFLAYRSFVLWQDRNNSIVDYTDEDGVSPGHIFCGDFAPGCSNTGGPRNNQSQEPLADRLNSSFPGGESTEMVLQSNPNVRIYGVAYQPRGAFLSVAGDGGSGNLLQIVSGAIRVQKNASLKLGPFVH